ncbi:MAG: hypothetical protein OER90_15755, partial [Gemmatimonadota bacterium]|nr:hypothetical protein [Gemmatimonadota bacterium]
MMRNAILVMLAAVVGTSGAIAQDPPADRQIAGAVSPLPDSLRPGAAVLGYRQGSLVALRQGTNAMICVADDPAASGFHAACYHRDLEPFMARGRALRAAGNSRPEVDSIRFAEIEGDRLPMPEHPAALYSVFLQSEFDPATGLPAEARGLYVIYMPYA